MSKKDKVHEDKDQPKVSVGLNLGGLFDGIQQLVEAAGKLKEAGQVSHSGEFEIPGLKDGKGIFGISVRTLVDGDTRNVEVRPFGNIHKTEKGVSVEETRQAVVDLFEEGKRIRVIAELPGVAEKDIKHEINGDVLRMWTDGDRRYEAEVLLPSAVKSDTVESSYRNGVFELRLEKK